MTLAQISAKLASGELVEWRVGKKRFRGCNVDGVIRVEWLVAEVWMPVDTGEALQELIQSRVSFLEPPKMDPWLFAPADVTRGRKAREKAPQLREARACLDIAFSVLKADLAGSPCPTMDAIAERPPKLLIGLVDPLSGLPDWRDPKDANHYGLFACEPNSRERAESDVRLTATAVFDALKASGFEEGDLKRLARMYPRRGIYATGRIYRNPWSAIAVLSRRAEEALVARALAKPKIERK